VERLVGEASGLKRYMCAEAAKKNIIQRIYDGSPGQGYANPKPLRRGL